MTAARMHHCTNPWSTPQHKHLSMHTVLMAFPSPQCCYSPQLFLLVFPSYPKRPSAKVNQEPDKAQHLAMHNR